MFEVFDSKVSVNVFGNVIFKLPFSNPSNDIYHSTNI